MGSFVFKWDHPAEEVYVTGTFDDWSKSEKLLKTGNSFSKDVALPNATEKIYYKFVVDGNWVTDHTAPHENDASGNLNNVLTPDRIVKHTPATAGIMSSVAPTSTTADLAKDVPLENEKTPVEPKGAADPPGATPETPAALEKVEKGDFSVNPLPAAEGAVNPIQLAPGEKVPDPGSFTTNTLTSGVHDDPDLVAADKAKTEGGQTFSVNPLPAFPGAVNPVTSTPGEKIPDASTLTTNTVTSGVHDDPELVAADKAKTEGEQTFSVNPLPAFPGAVNPITSTPGEKIPDASTLTANTVNSTVTTDKESYEKRDGVGYLPVLPPVVTPGVEGSSSGTGALDLPPAVGLIPESSLPMGSSGVGTFDATPTIQSTGPSSTTAGLAAAVPLESTKVPEIVKESQEKANVDPEASAIPEEVKEKSAVEKELLKEVPVAPSTSEGTAGKGTDKSEPSVAEADAAAAVSATVTTPETIAKDTPEIVKESIAESGRAPEAAASEEAVSEKKAVEEQLLSKVKPETSTGEPAPQIISSDPKSTLAAPTPAPAASDSRDVSPGTVPGSHSTADQAAPAAKNASDTTPAKPADAPASPAKAPSGGSNAGDSPANAGTTDKKKKRLSFFNKIKAKLGKDKDPSSS